MSYIHRVCVTQITLNDCYIAYAELPYLISELTAIKHTLKTYPVINDPMVYELSCNRVLGKKYQRISFNMEMFPIRHSICNIQINKDICYFTSFYNENDGDVWIKDLDMFIKTLKFAHRIRWNQPHETY